VPLRVIERCERWKFLKRNFKKLSQFERGFLFMGAQRMDRNHTAEFGRRCIQPERIIKAKAAVIPPF